MILAIALAFSLVLATFAFHYRVLLWLSSKTQKPNSQRQSQVLIIVIVLFLAHIVEIGFYAAIYNWSVLLFDLGVFEGAPVGSAMNYMYYSGVVYTTLGLGDIQPLGHIRFITAVESLNGFLLITWSASFTFLAMGRLWPWDVRCTDSVEENER